MNEIDKEIEQEIEQEFLQEHQRIIPILRERLNKIIASLNSELSNDDRQKQKNNLLLKKVNEFIAYLESGGGIDPLFTLVYLNQNFDESENDLLLKTIETVDKDFKVLRSYIPAKNKNEVLNTTKLINRKNDASHFIVFYLYQGLYKENISNTDIKSSLELMCKHIHRKFIEKKTEKKTEKKEADKKDISLAGNDDYRVSKLKQKDSDLLYDYLCLIEEGYNKNDTILMINAAFELGQQTLLLELQNKDFDIDRRIFKSLNKGSLVTEKNMKNSDISREDAIAFFEDYINNRLNYSSDTKFYKSLANNKISDSAVKKALQRLMKNEQTYKQKFNKFKEKHNLR